MKLWKGWEKLHIKGTFRWMSTGFFLASIYTNSHGFSEVWACLCLCHNRKHKVSRNSDETEQDDPLCPWGCRSSRMHLTALLGCIQRHTRSCPQSHVNTGTDEGWKNSRWSCSLIAVWCFVSLADLHLYSLSPSQITFSSVIFHHWRRDWVFSSAWNVHWKESSLFCSMCFC